VQESFGAFCLVELHYFGHSFFKLSFGDKNVLIDPFVENSNKSQDFRRLQQCSAKDSDLKGISALLVSHEHFDHFDKGLVKKIAERDNACVVSHESLLQQIDLQKRYLHPISIGEKISVRGLTIKGITAHHPQAFYPLGFLVECNGESVYHAGDTDLLDDYSGIRADVALLPIGGNFTMDAVDAVRATKAMKPKFAVPMHYNTFKLIQADANEFKNKIEKSILKTKPIIMKPGDKVSL
jgi:L-ascorbate metabolism protein UlaG (beta-lactamase superfamily)